MSWKRHIPNLITSLRIIAAIIMIFLEPLSLAFYVVYGACGLSDAIDGFIARKFHYESKLGSILDSVADLIFYTVMGIKIIPVMIELLNVVHWLLILIPVGIQIVAYILCAFKFHRFSSLHTYGNKVLGALVFLFPFTFIGRIELLYSIYIYIGGAVALYASLETLLIHIFAKRYDMRNKSIFLIKRNERREDGPLIEAE